MIFRLTVILFFFSLSIFSQEKYIKHTVSKGDNLTAIAKKYGIKAKDIQEANPNAPKVLKLNSVLLIPNKNQVVETKPAEKAVNTNTPGSHEVLPKETLWGISKKYNVSVDDLKKANPLLETEGLKIGQQINIPSESNTSNIVASADKSIEKTLEKPVEKPVITTDVEVFREVLPKETKYGISKEYGITVAELERQNPAIKGKTPAGYLLKIKIPKERADAIEAAKAGQVVKDTTTVYSGQIAQNNPEIKRDSTYVYNGSHSDLIDGLIENATQNIGTRYRSGGTTKAGFDCSGLMISTFGSFSIKLPRSSIEQSRIGTVVNSQEAQKGDLIFFRTNGRRQINHVGMVVDVVDGEIKFVHSSIHGGVMISSTRESYYERAFSQVNRVF
ncbi:LysM peptidoglycan-binding domain-containing protein [Flavobacterium sp. MC2016-06]|uniref:C40 family peptidase n=1 Tax=Flavobacterium sp. MC2016-06 TaxID=2676308 RepID=UPI0012BB0075|nr:peptidoglycan endopeptidase [Flavobacterium sp. MC2016-06]MBU3859951.1 LysM peptidoglycan-binding domain-containing protein [Flavobacterium sp. MC2016-06]